MFSIGPSRAPLNAVTEWLSSHTATRQGSESRVVLRLLGAHSLPLLFQTQAEGDALTLTSDPPAALPSPGLQVPGLHSPEAATGKSRDAWFLETGRPSALFCSW